MSEPLISLCMIVKNEEDNLPGCLESVRGLVDEIIVIDTGSNDRTVLVAESLGAKVFSVPWEDDFAAARNESLSRASGNWILYLDADERLVSNGVRDCVRATAAVPGIDAWSVSIRNYKYDTEVFDSTLNIRLFRRLPEVLFENEVHERVEPALARIGACIRVAPFAIDHLGYRIAPERLKAKLERNLALSKKQLNRGPDPYCLYYVGITLLLLDRSAESEEYFRRAMESPDVPLYLYAMLCNITSYRHLLSGKADECLSLAEKSRGMVPCQNTSYLLSGLAYFRKSEYRAALPFLIRAREFQRTPPEKRQSELTQEYAFIDEAEFLKLIAICYSQTDRFAEAVELFREFIKLSEPDREILKLAGICAINAGDFGLGLELLGRIDEHGPEYPGIVLPMALACLQLNELDRAQALLDTARKNPDRNPEIESKIEKLLENRRAPAPAVASTCSVQKISLCMIVKDEQKWLPGCLESVRGFVDEIVVVDTGSSDQTVAIARSFGAEVFHYRWNDDFSQARNESLRHATGDWILFLDADERLDPIGGGDCLRQSACGLPADAFLVPILNRSVDAGEQTTVGSAIRFFRNIPGIRFSGRVHEGVDRFLSLKGATILRGPFAVNHLGYAQDQETVQSKYRRNLELIGRELEEEPENPYMRYHLGLTFMALGEEARAREAFDRALRTPGLNSSLEAMILNMKGYHHLRAGELDPAFVAASRSLALVPVQNTARLLTGLVLFRKGSFDLALPKLLESYEYLALPPEERQSDIYFEDSIAKTDLIEIIGVCFSEAGKPVDALPFLKLTALVKRDSVAYERLGICMLNSGDFSGAVQNLEKSLALGANRGSLALPLAYALFVTGDYAAAASSYRNADPKDSNELAVALRLADTMAAEERFRPYLAECVQFKQKLLRQAAGKEP